MKTSCGVILFLAIWVALASLASAGILSKRSAPNQNIIPGEWFNENDGLRAADAAAPLWHFGRMDINGHDPCYPEGATNGRGGINPGTEEPMSPNPGADCRDPPDWHGRFTPGDSFPNYITRAYCVKWDEWRITYSIYFVHDGAGSQGHRHDWESATIVFKRSVIGHDMWYRSSLILTQHDLTEERLWQDVETFTKGKDISKNAGPSGAHPRVYVGFFKHGIYFNRLTRWKVWSALSPSAEYRSNDWVIVGELEKGDFVPNRHMARFEQKYGHATSDPAFIQGSTCCWGNGTSQGDCFESSGKETKEP